MRQSQLKVNKLSNCASLVLDIMAYKGIVHTSLVFLMSMCVTLYTIGTQVSIVMQVCLHKARVHAQAML